MAIQDAQPVQSPLGMAVANNAFLGALIQTLLDKKVFTRIDLMNMIAAARRDVNRIQDDPSHRDADFILGLLQKRFPVV
jgi:hypothetical protein